MAVGDKASDQVDHEVRGAAMAGVLDLADVLELIGDGLDDRSFAQEDLVRPGDQALVHVLAQLRDELEPLGHEELLRQRLGDVPPIAKQLAEQPLDQLGHGLAVIDVTRRQAERQQFAAVVDHPVQL